MHSELTSLQNKPQQRGFKIAMGSLSIKDIQPRMNMYKKIIFLGMTRPVLIHSDSRCWVIQLGGFLCKLKSCSSWPAVTMMPAQTRVHYGLVWPLKSCNYIMWGDTLYGDCHSDFIAFGFNLWSCLSVILEVVQAWQN